ncbi:hypothetical protein LCGC14_2984180 [marine sediment metagenome]|uniref:Uncharacterized protein n=1 Tax=marine sediment metagenome TaxID=412755 RepID=A0A0F8ZD83_9ZZZZ
MDYKIAMRIRLLYYLGLNYMPSEVAYGDAYNWDMEVISCAFQRGIHGVLNMQKVMCSPHIKLTVMEVLAERLEQYG